MNFERGQNPRAAMGVGRRANAKEIASLQISGTIFGNFDDPDWNRGSTNWEFPRIQHTIYINGIQLTRLLKILKNPRSYNTFYQILTDLIIQKHKRKVAAYKGEKAQILWNYREIKDRGLYFVIKSIDGKSEQDHIKINDLIGEDVIYNDDLYPINYGVY